MEVLLRRLNTQRSSPSVQEAAAKAVLQRLLPTHLSSFEFKIISKDVCGGHSCFWISNYMSSRNGPEIMIKGTTAVEIASGLHWYIKYWCGAHVSWDKTGGIQIASIPEPGSLPLVEDEGVMIKRPVPWNYYQNVVTSSYSYVWWDWEKWEKEIDWMALQGVNLPLAFTGQEAIWQKVFMDHNIDFIVKFPDWDPSLSSRSDISKHNQMQKLLTVPSNRRFLFQKTNSDLPQSHIWYSTQDVINALRLFLDAGNDLSGSLTYRYDLIDLTRQVLSKLANDVYLNVVTAFRQRDANSLHFHSQKFVQLIKDIDALLASDDNFLLGPWLESAKNLAVNPSEMRQYEWNARTQVTMWYDNTKTIQSKLHDYANKFWSGLLEHYYLPRASTYFGYLSESLRENKKFKLEEWRKEWISYSNKWQAGTELYPVKAEGDALAIANALYTKYLH